MNYYVEVWRKYAQFSGRARRAEYWYFFLFNLIIALVLDSIAVFLIHPFIVIYWLYALAVIIPSLAVGARRLHDTDRSGWWLLLGIIPVVGTIILLVWFATDGQPDANKYGPNPKGV